MTPTHRLAATLLAVAALVAVRPAPAEVTVDFAAHSFSHAQAVPIHEFVHDWEHGFRAGGRTAFSFSETELSARYGRFGFGLLRRYDYLLKFSPDLAELAWLANNDLPLQPGRVYRIELEGNHFVGNGIRLSYELQPARQLSVRLAASWLHGQELTEGRSEGWLTGDGDRYDSQLHLDYAYTDERLFGRRVGDTAGHGYSLDLDVDWRPAANWQLYLRGRDLVSRIEWQDQPYTDVVIDSANQHFDDDGFIHYRPVLSGRHGYRDHTQELPWRATVGVEWRVGGPWGVGAQLEALEHIRFPRASLSYQPAGLR